MLLHVVIGSCFWYLWCLRNTRNVDNRGCLQSWYSMQHISSWGHWFALVCITALTLSVGWHEGRLCHLLANVLFQKKWGKKPHRNQLTQVNLENSDLSGDGDNWTDSEWLRWMMMDDIEQSAGRSMAMSSCQVVLWHLQSGRPITQTFLAEHSVCEKTRR